MTWRFSPPLRGYGPSYRADADRVTQALWGHFHGAWEPVSTLKSGDTYTDQTYVYSDDIDAADRFYQGGHVYDVDDDEAFALEDAGYTVVPSLMAELQEQLNILAGTVGLDAQAAANAWAGTSGLELLGALNSRNGTSGLGLNAVCNALAGTSGLEAQAALASISLDPLLAEAVLLLRASEFVGDPGDDWNNEGTGGSTLDAVADGTPVHVDSPTPGFETADGSSGSQGASSPFYYVPDSALLDPGAGSFSAFAWTTWTVSSPGGNENVMSKITGTITQADGRGWTVFDSSFFDGPTVALDAGGANPGVDPAISSAGDHLDPGTHLIVIRLDRDDDSALDIFVDGVQGTPGDASAVATVAAAHELIFGRGCEQTVHGFGYWDRALTDTEITVDLPAALGIE